MRKKEMLAGFHLSSIECSGFWCLPGNFLTASAACDERI